MKNSFLIIICMFVLFLNAGCQSTKSRAVEGAVIGGVVGATAGGIIGHQSHHGGEGAGIGAAVGALTGAIVGSQIAKPAQATPSTSATQDVNTNQMTIQQIVDFTKQGINEDVIIDRIRLTNSKFKLSTEDVNYLKQQGVSQKVIDAMQ